MVEIEMVLPSMEIVSGRSLCDWLCKVPEVPRYPRASLTTLFTFSRLLSCEKSSKTIKSVKHGMDYCVVDWRDF